MRPSWQKNIHMYQYLPSKHTKSHQSQVTKTHVSVWVFVTGRKQGCQPHREVCIHHSPIPKTWDGLGNTSKEGQTLDCLALTCRKRSSTTKVIHVLLSPAAPNLWTSSIFELSDWLCYMRQNKSFQFMCDSGLQLRLDTSNFRLMSLRTYLFWVVDWELPILVLTFGSHFRC